MEESHSRLLQEVERESSALEPGGSGLTNALSTTDDDEASPDPPSRVLDQCEQTEQFYAAAIKLTLRYQ